MVSTPDHRKSIRVAHKSAIMVTDEHSKYFLFAQMINFCVGGLYFESDFALKQDTKIQIQFVNPPFRSGPKTSSSVVRWCRKLTAYDTDYTYGVGVQFI
jgi:hypothetical protein